MNRFYSILLLFFTLSLIGSCGSEEKEFIKVGIIRPQKLYAGEMIEKGILMAVEEANSLGGILGKRIIPIMIDDGNKSDTGTLNLRKAIETQNIDYILGGFNSTVVLACMDVMAEYQKLWLGTGGASPQVIQKIKDNPSKYQYYFRVGTIDSVDQGYAGGDFIVDYMGPKYGLKKIALVGADQNYSRFILGMTKKRLEANGYEIVYENYFPTHTNDFTPVFNQIRQKGANLIFEAWPSSEAVTFVKQYHRQKIPAILLGAVIESLKDEYFEETGGASVYEAGFSPQSGPAPMTTKTMEFARKFKQKYGKSAGYIAYPAYDTVKLLKAAAEKANSLDTQQIIRTLEYLEMEGNIWYKFTEDHDLTKGIRDGRVYATFVWFQWQPDGTRKAFYPEAFKQVDYRLAPWVEESFRKKAIIR
jgi:branched-chain amino acid transport system substrate-binding protein